MQADPAVLPHSTSPGKTTVTWSTGDGSVGQVYVTANGDEERLVAMAPSGSFEAPWISPGTLVEFRLYQGTDRTELLGVATVHQVNSGQDKARWAGLMAVVAALILLAIGMLLFARVGRGKPSMSAAPPARSTAVSKIDALTSLRFPAAATIVFLHFRSLPGFPTRLGDPFPFQIGVAFFFVLSGFILTYAYPQLEPRELLRFWWARIARIWPAHIVGLVFAALLLPWAEVYPTRTAWPLLEHLTLTQAWAPNSEGLFAFNQPSWSISDELAFYLSFPLLLIVFARSRALLLFGSAVLLGGLLMIGALLFEGPDSNPSLILPIYVVYMNPMFRQFDFVLGMCACHVWRQLRSNTALTRDRCTIAEILAIAASIATANALGQAVSGYLRDDLGAAVGLWMDYCATAIPFSALIVVIALGRGYISQALRWAPLVLLGEISYSVYLLHYTIARGLVIWEWPKLLPLWIIYPSAWAATLLLAYLVWRFVEKPARRYLVSLTGGSATQPGPARAEMAGVKV